MKFLMESSWNEELSEEFAKPYLIELQRFVEAEYSDAEVFPESGNIFNAFKLTPFSQVKVVILGQDPYHGVGQAHGLSFSVIEGVRNPPSLRNIFKEIESDLAIIPNKENGDLTRWSKQGVLLLNSTLTVRSGIPGSHQGKGWEQFTDAVIKALSDKCEHLVFILWGNYAKAKGAQIDRAKHLVIESPHPSPFSAHSGFFGSKPFGKTNEYLAVHNETVIDWS